MSELTYLDQLFLCLSSPLSSMFSQQQASPQFTQQNNSNMYNGNGMNLNNVSMATNMATSSMGQMAGQMSVTSMASGPSPGLPSMGQEQVNTRPILTHPSSKWAKNQDTFGTGRSRKYSDFSRFKHFSFGHHLAWPDHIRGFGVAQ